MALSRPVRIWGALFCYFAVAIVTLHYLRANPNSTGDKSSPFRPFHVIYGDTPKAQQPPDTTQPVAAYPTDYLPSPKDSEECEAMYSHRYLDYIATHHIPYCKDGSRSSFECFRTHMNQSMCLAKTLLIDQTRTEPNHHAALHCELRNFTTEANADPAAAEALHGVLNVEDMPWGFFDTGVKHQLKAFDLNTTDETMVMGEQKCEPGKTDGKWTLLVRRENHKNVWHQLMELWSAMVSLDVLQMSIDPSTQKPYLQQSELSDMQIVFTESDEGIPGLNVLDDWWDMVTGNSPILQRDMQPTCLDKVVLPLVGMDSPFWAWHWFEKDCHDRFLLDAFLKRVYRFLNIVPKKHGAEEKTVVTIVGSSYFLTKLVFLSIRAPEAGAYSRAYKRITPVCSCVGSSNSSYLRSSLEKIRVFDILILGSDRKNRRKLRNAETMMASAQERWPKVIFQLVDFAPMSLKDQVLVARNTSVFVGLTGAGLTHILWLPEESSVAEIQAPNKRMPEAQPYGGFRNLSKMRNLHYFTAHPERREGEGHGNEWQTGEWVDMKPEVFQALIDAAINAQIHKGESPGEVLPVGT